MIVIQCDNPNCNNRLDTGAPYHELVTSNPMPTFSTPADTTKQFCSLGCVAEYCAGLCGMETPHA